MLQVIVFTNENGNVSVCIPSGELPIEQVQIKDTPIGSVIIDSSTLPFDNQWFNAWELNGLSVTVNFIKAQQIALNIYNKQVANEYSIRQINEGIGIETIPSNQNWLEKVNAQRNAIKNATTLNQLNDILNNMP